MRIGLAPGIDEDELSDHSGLAKGKIKADQAAQGMSHEIEVGETQLLGNFQHIIRHGRDAAIGWHLATGASATAMIIGDDPIVIR